MIISFSWRTDQWSWLFITFSVGNCLYKFHWLVR